MYSLLLAIIYIAFISLGLPDPLLGAAWPVMYQELGASISWAGMLSMLIAGGTIVSSLLSDRLNKRFGAGLVTAISVAMTAAALLGFSFSGSFWQLCLWALPYGLGAGAVDAALNNYVALHYSSRHMNWLHGFWGVGTSISPFIMGFCLSYGFGWNTGYGSVGVFQVLLCAVLFCSLPLWRKPNDTPEEAASGQVYGLKDVIKLPGVKQILLAFFCYCAVESTAGLWASTYLAEYRGVDSETAARFASLFYLGITGGRFLSGFVADRLGDKTLVRIGVIGMLVGGLCVALPTHNPLPALMGLVILGLGSAPIYPSFIHQTPSNFGREYSQAIVGIQMASAYTGSTLMPPLCGVLLEHISLGLYPLCMLLLTVVLLTASETLNRIVKKLVK